MSSSPSYPNHAATMYSQEQLSHLATNNVTSQWYAPNSFAFDSSFMTPLPSSTTAESQPWTQLARASAPDASMNQYTYHTNGATFPQYYDPSKMSTGRPRSSPSTFGPSSETIPWPLTNGLGIFPNGPIGQPTPITSTFPPNVFQTFAAADDQYVKDTTLVKDEQQSIASSTPEIRQPQPRRPYANIQPDPVGIAAQKRSREEDEPSDINAPTKRRKRTSSVVSADLSEDDRLLVTLKEEQNLPWKDIASRYSAEKGKTVQVAALQMKYKRLREKYRVWTESDITALKQAYDMWEKRKWEIISEKMLDFGVDERWNAKQVARKWQEMEMTATTMAVTAGITPAMSHFSTSQFSSPIEAPAHSHFSWMPLT